MRKDEAPWTLGSSTETPMGRRLIAGPRRCHRRISLPTRTHAGLLLLQVRADSLAQPPIADDNRVDAGRRHLHEHHHSACDVLVDDGGDRGNESRSVAADGVNGWRENWRAGTPPSPAACPSAS